MFFLYECELLKGNVAGNAKDPPGLPASGGSGCSLSTPSYCLDPLIRPPWLPSQQQAAAQQQTQQQWSSVEFERFWFIGRRNLYRREPFALHAVISR